MRCSERTAAASAGASCLLGLVVWRAVLLTPAPRHRFSARSRAAGLECLLPPTSNRTRYSGATYTPTARARKPSAAPAPIEAATTSLLETELPSPDGPVAGPSTLPPLAGPSTLPPLAVDDPSLITTMTGPTTSDLEHLLPLLSPAASSSALALLGPQPDCPPSSSWDPFEACFDLSGPSNYQQAPLSPNSLFQQWPGRMSGFESGSPLEFLGSLDLYGAVGSLSPMRFTSESLSRATSALTVKYVSPDTRLIQDCCERPLRNSSAPLGSSKTDARSRALSQTPSSTVRTAASRGSLPLAAVLTPPSPSAPPQARGSTTPRRPTAMRSARSRRACPSSRATSSSKSSSTSSRR